MIKYYEWMIECVGLKENGGKLSAFGMIPACPMVDGYYDQINEFINFTSYLRRSKPYSIRAGLKRRPSTRSLSLCVGTTQPVKSLVE